jgi:hypothetical protein
MYLQILAVRKTDAERPGGIIGLDARNNQSKSDIVRSDDEAKE